jgi:hypothetical protein
VPTPWQRDLGRDAARLERWLETRYYGVTTPEQGRAFELDNTVMRLLAKLLELPPPGEPAGA